jgi:hypothetical protein
MPWSSQYAAQFSKPLVRQIVALIYRDQRAALDDVAGVDVLPNFAEFDIAKVPILQYPGIFIAAHRERFDEESQQTLHATVELAGAVAVTHQDRNVLAEICADYVRAVDEILRSAFERTPSDFYASGLALPARPAGPFAPGETTIGLTSGILKRLWIESHDFTEAVSAPQSLFAMAAGLSIVAELEES